MLQAAEWIKLFMLPCKFELFRYQAKDIINVRQRPKDKPV